MTASVPLSMDPLGVIEILENKPIEFFVHFHCPYCEYTVESNHESFTVGTILFCPDCRRYYEVVSFDGNGISLREFVNVF